MWLQTEVLVISMKWSQLDQCICLLLELLLITTAVSSLWAKCMIASSYVAVCHTQHRSPGGLATFLLQLLCCRLLQCHAGLKALSFGIFWYVHDYLRHFSILKQLLLISWYNTFKYICMGSWLFGWLEQLTHTNPYSVKKPPPPPHTHTFGSSSAEVNLSHLHV